jgi:putative peptidoglycan lipid II flippase
LTELTLPVTAVGVMVATQLLNLVFVPLFGVAGLALSIGVGACINAAFLYTGLRRRHIYVPQPGWGTFFVKLLVAVSVMGAVSWFGQAQFDWIALRATPLLRAGALATIIAAAALAYFAVLVLLGFRPRDFKRRAK